MTYAAFFAALWDDYRRTAPHVSALHAALEARGEVVVNDHVAFRTFAGPTFGIGALEPHLIALGYRRFEPYAFADKHLDAWAYVHPDPTAPRVFLSELRRGALSPAAERIIDRLVAEVDPERVARPDVFWAGRLWSPVAFEDYERLAAESEYAAWVAALGIRANHFTVSVNHLRAIPNLEALLAVVEQAGGVIATAGGRIKGGPHEGLEQASTVADRQPVTFAGGVTRVIPTCYYEFARRYPRVGDPDGPLHQGFVPASADRLFESTDRAAPMLLARSAIDGSVLEEIPMATEADVARAAEAAMNAFRVWRTVPAPVRGRLVQRIRERLEGEADAIAALITREVGKIPAEARGEVQEWLDICDFAVGLSRQLHGLTIASERPDHRMMEQWHPLGPVACITAFNFPAAVWSWNAMIGLVCGDPIVWKPSEKASLTALACHRVVLSAMADVGAPDGLVSLLIGRADIGKALINDRRFPLVSATGSVAMGRAVGVAVAERLGRSLLELGGNNAMIVTPSADLTLAARAAVFAAVGTAGQRCTSLRRLLVHESVADTLVERLRSAFGRLPIGDPRTPGVLVGPLIDDGAAQAMARALTAARAQGGEVLAGGERLHDGVPAGGAYVAPALVRIAADAPIVAEETFAPILYVSTWRNFDEAIARQNGVPQGLSSSVFTSDLREAERFLSAAGSDCGMANVNIGTSGAEIGGAFGGDKESGGGRESGSDAWKAYMRRATNTINYGDDLHLAQGIRFEP